MLQNTQEIRSASRTICQVHMFAYNLTTFNSQSMEGPFGVLLGLLGGCLGLFGAVGGCLVAVWGVLVHFLVVFRRRPFFLHYLGSARRAWWKSIQKSHCFEHFIVIFKYIYVFCVKNCPTGMRTEAVFGESADPGACGGDLGV